MRLEVGWEGKPYAAAQALIMNFAEAPADSFAARRRIFTLPDNKFKFGGYSWRIFACGEYNGFGAKLWRQAAV